MSDDHPIPTPPLNFKSRPKRALRLFIFRRDRFTCCECGWTPLFVPVDYDGSSWPPFDSRIDRLHVDHIVPRCVGGPSCVSNLRTLCESCNCRKGTADRLLLTEAA